MEHAPTVEPERPQLENRFGDEEAVVEQLSAGEVKVIGSVDEVYPDIIARHRNLVDLTEVDLGSPTTKVPKNRSETVVISDNQHEPILAVYKPVSGENKLMQQEFHHKFYSREYVAYLVSRHFYFDLVPPTVIREVNGEIGSLQLFMPPPDYLPANKVVDTFSETDYDHIVNSDEVRKLLLLDHILANSDRHHDNYLYQVNSSGDQLVLEQGEPTIIAIDHGMSLDEKYYRQARGFNVFRGPYQFLTTDNLTRKTRETPIEDELMNLLRNGSEHRSLLDNHLRQVPDIEHDELGQMWQRVDELIETGTFISPMNWNEVRQQHP